MADGVGLDGVDNIDLKTFVKEEAVQGEPIVAGRFHPDDDVFPVWVVRREISYQFLAAVRSVCESKDFPMRWPSPLMMEASCWFFPMSIPQMSMAIPRVWLFRIALCSLCGLQPRSTSGTLPWQAAPSSLFVDSRKGRGKTLSIGHAAQGGKLCPLSDACIVPHASLHRYPGYGLYYTSQRVS